MPFVELNTIFEFLQGTRPIHPVKVLIVDAQQEVRDTWRQMLLSLDIEVVCAGSTREAIDEINNEDPDILILDWKLDRVNGSSVLDWWVRRERGPCIVVSGYLNEISTDDLYLRGVRNVFLKPLAIATLRAIVMYYRGCVMSQRMLHQMQARTGRLERTVFLLIILFAAFEGPKAIEWLFQLVT